MSSRFYSALKTPSSQNNLTSSAKLFKGIALFTPGGDLVYCIDPHKRSRWHLQLCAVLQEMLGLSEPPHFLSPCYAATVDRWIDPRTQQLQTVAEASPLIMRHQALLNAIFGTGELLWTEIPALGEVCDPMVMATYREQFPQLWETHELVVRSEQADPQAADTDGGRSTLSWEPVSQSGQTQGYVLRLFVSGNNAATEDILHNLHQLLERSLRHPYTLKVVDIYKHPDLAEADQIAAIPTLVKAWPLPVRRIVGDLNNVSKILQVFSSPQVYVEEEMTKK